MLSWVCLSLGQLFLGYLFHNILVLSCMSLVISYYLSVFIIKVKIVTVSKRKEKNHASSTDSQQSMMNLQMIWTSLNFSPQALIFCPFSNSSLLFIYTCSLNLLSILQNFCASFLFRTHFLASQGSWREQWLCSPRVEVRTSYISRIHPTSEWDIQGFYGLVRMKNVVMAVISFQSLHPVVCLIKKSTFTSRK